MKKITYIITDRKNRERLLLAGILLLAACAHGINMFAFPYYENDEGTYMSQAWSVLTMGKLSPYTYWYDHAPAGWLFLAAWVKLTGGFFTFGTAVNSGRVFMLVLHILSSFMLYTFTKKISNSMSAGLLAILLFSLSPLGIYFQRRVLLDNIMVFWVLLSLVLLVVNKLKLRHIALSGLSFGIAVLTKENAVFFLPAFLYALFIYSHSENKRFAFAVWLSITISTLSLYLLYAVLKSEFLPVGFLSGNAPHVSLITTLSNQLNRGAELPLWHPQSDLTISMRTWLEKDAFSILLGTLATGIGVIMSIKDKSLRLPTLLAISFLAFLLRGKLVIDFYVIPLLPVFSLLTALIVHKGILTLKKFSQKGYSIAMFACLLGVIFFSASRATPVWLHDETTPQIKTLQYTLTHVPTDAVIAIDDFAEVEFREHGYTKAAWFWKIWNDPAVKEMYQGKSENIEYMYLSHEMLKQMSYRDTSDPLVKAYLSSMQLAQYGPISKGTYLNPANFITTNGDWAALYQQATGEALPLFSGWEYYKKHYITPSGQVVDTDALVTTSEGQSYAMLRAVTLNDKKTFATVWQWTKDHFQHRTEDYLLSWKWSAEDETGFLLDSATASDADEDIALALLMASEKWNDPVYLKEAKEIITDIWRKEVVFVNGRYYLISGADQQTNTGYLLNPSYLSPASYRLFAKVDWIHDWDQLATDSYYLLNTLGNEPGNTTYLPKNWVHINRETGELSSASAYRNDADNDKYGFDAFRTLWRVALDVQWFENKEAKAYLQKVSPFFIEEWENNKSFAGIYTLSGQAAVPYTSLSTSVGALSVLNVIDKSRAQEIYKQLFESKYNFIEGYWGDKENYYDQNWAWLGTALYNNAIKKPQVEKAF